MTLHVASMRKPEHSGSLPNQFPAQMKKQLVAKILELLLKPRIRQLKLWLLLKEEDA